MPYKDPQKQKEAQRRWYERQDKAERVEQNRKERAKRRDAVEKFKREHGCSRCGYDRCMAALEFHHCKGEKNFAIAQAIVDCKPIQLILAKLELCELVCANCHREEHERLNKIPSCGIV